MIPETIEETTDGGLPCTTCSPCAECGMPVNAGEYHPFAACLMFKACHNSAVVKANLWAVQERSMKIGWENHEDFCRENADVRRDDGKGLPT